MVVFMDEYEQYLQQRCHISALVTDRVHTQRLYADYLKWVNDRYTPATRRFFVVGIRRALMRVADRCPTSYSVLRINGKQARGFNHIVLRTAAPQPYNPHHRLFDYGFEIEKQPPRVQEYLRDRCEPGTHCVLARKLPDSLLTTLFYAWETRYPDHSTTVWFAPDVPWRPTVQKSDGVIPNALTASEIARILEVDRDVAQMAVRTEQFQGTHFPRNRLAGRVPTWSLDLSLGRIDLTERLRAVDWLLQQDAANFKARYEIRKAVIGPRTEQADRLAGALSILPPSNNRAAELLEYLLDTASNSSLTSAALPTK